MASKQQEPLYWLTTKSGKHIPIFDKDPKKNAEILKARREAYKKSHPDKETGAHVEPFTRMANHLAKQGISNEDEIANYLRGLSATRRSKLAREMGIESRGDDKIKEMAHRIYLAGKNEPSTPQPSPATQKVDTLKTEPAKKEEPKKAEVKKADKVDFDYPDYENILGEKKDINVMNEISEAMKKNPDNKRVGSFVNSNYRDERSPQQVPYHKNCALCTAALMLRTHGYDVEAMPLDKTWRGAETILDFDYTNPDNFLLGSAKNSWDNWGVTRTVLGKDRLGQININDYQRMPRGANQAATAIIDKMKHWGDGAMAELSVDWKGRKSGHSVVMVNIGGEVFLFDGQTGHYYAGHESLSRYLKGTVASHTELVRIDNAPLKSGDLSSALSKMVRERDTSSVSGQLSAGLAGVDWDKF